MSASLAFVFPGQGSQSLGMLAELGAQRALIRDTFGEASEALGYDLWALVQQGPEERLNETDKTQPAILTASVALWRLWQAEAGARPAFVAGHSLGEYSALVATGAIEFRDAVKKRLDYSGIHISGCLAAGERFESAMFEQKFLVWAK